MTIERVGAGHAAVLAAIYTASLAAVTPYGSGGEVWGASAFEAQLSMHGVVALLDRRGGMALVRITADEAELLTIAVIPSARRRGVARGLLLAQMANASELGARQMFLEVAVGNRNGLALYRSLGFEDVGRRRAYYANGQDARVMRVALPVATATWRRQSRPMRIHVHNGSAPSIFTVKETQFAEAAARAGAAHAVSFGNSAEALKAVLPEVEVLVSGTGPLAEVLPLLHPEHAPKLRLIFTVAAGIDSLPRDQMPPVPFINNRGAHTEKAAEFVTMALLMLTSGMPGFIKDQQEKRWEQRFFRGLRGRKLTVLGLGAMGGASAEQAAHFGMEVTGIRGTPKPHPACRSVVGVEMLDAVLPETEFLLVSCPLTDKTRHIVDRRRLALLPRGAFLINIGRGPLIEQTALCDALDGDHLGGAVLDVFDPEPVPVDDRIWTTRNLVMTPHAAVDDVVSYIPRSLDVFFANLAAMETGEPLLTPVDFARGY